MPVRDPPLREHPPLALAVARRRRIDLAVAEREEVGLRTEAVETEAVEDAGAPVRLVWLAEGLKDAPLACEAPEAFDRATRDACVIRFLTEPVGERLGRFARLDGPSRQPLGRLRVPARDARRERVVREHRRLEREGDVGQEATLRLGSLFGRRTRDVRTRVLCWIR